MKVEQTKRTGRAERVRPSFVCYDPSLSLHLPLSTSLESLFNALAQAIAHLSANEVTQSKRAIEASTRLHTVINQLDASPQDLLLREQALYGAYLASGCIEETPLGLHHAIAHTLGGLGVRHSAAHTLTLPHSLALMLTSHSGLKKQLSQFMGDNPSQRLYRLAVRCQLPTNLTRLLPVLPSLDHFVELVRSRNYILPSGMKESDLRELCDRLLNGRPPVDI